MEADSSKQRSFDAEELIDQIISPDDYFGMTGSQRRQVWRFDGATAVRVGHGDRGSRAGIRFAGRDKGVG